MRRHATPKLRAAQVPLRVVAYMASLNAGLDVGPSAARHPQRLAKHLAVFNASLEVDLEATEEASAAALALAEAPAK